MKRKRGSSTARTAEAPLANRDAGGYDFRLREVTVSRAIRRCSAAAALILLAACGAGGPAHDSKASGGPGVPPAVYSVEDFYKNTQFRGAGWSADGKTILVSSDLSGIWNAYAVSAAGGAPQALTRSTTNSVFALSYFPADNRILYSSDQGGNELTHIYVRNLDASTADLTPGAKLKANFHGWAGDDRSFLVSTNERDERYFDLYEIATDGYQRTLLYQNTAGFDLGTISRDKRYLALVKPRTSSDADVFLHDRARGTTRNITAHTGNVNNARRISRPTAPACSSSRTRGVSLRRCGASRWRPAPPVRSTRSAGISPVPRTRSEFRGICLRAVPLERRSSRGSFAA